jgi:kinesin family protein 15
MEMLKKQLEFLAEENGKLVGHQNLHQKIQYVVRLKKENIRLTEVKLKLFSINGGFKEILVKKIVTAISLWVF